MKKILISLVFIMSAITMVMVSATPSYAQNKDQKDIINDLGSNAGGNDNFNLPNTEVSDTTLQNMLQTIFALSGAVSVIFVAVGGLRYVISDGNDQKIKQAKDTITYSLVGFVISISAYGIVGFFLTRVL